jgi:hypothetical protein
MKRDEHALALTTWFQVRDWEHDGALPMPMPPRLAFDLGIRGLVCLFILLPPCTITKDGRPKCVVKGANSKLILELCSLK